MNTLTRNLLLMAIGVSACWFIAPEIRAWLRKPTPPNAPPAASTPINDAFTVIRNAGTSGGSFRDNNAIIRGLTKWQAICSFTVTGATHDTVDIVFSTLPEDMDTFVRKLYVFCPDLVDQGTGVLHERINVKNGVGRVPDPKLQKLIEGVDFRDEHYGLEILKREILRDKALKLWWD